jgi:hypothetical protein
MIFVLVQEEPEFKFGKEYMRSIYYLTLNNFYNYILNHETINYVPIRLELHLTLLFNYFANSLPN